MTNDVVSRFGKESEMFKIGCTNVGMDCKTGLFSVEENGVILRNCQAVLDVDNKRTQLADWSLVEECQGKAVFETRTDDGEWRICFSTSGLQEGVETLEIRLSGAISGDARRLTLIPLFAQEVPADHAVINGRGSGSCRIMTLPREKTEEFDSSFELVVRSSDRYLHFSHPMTQSNVSVFKGRAGDGSAIELSALSTVEYPEQGKRYESEPVFLHVETDGHAAMIRWADSQKIQGRDFPDQPAGWNSWDYYRWTITEDELFANAEFIKNDPVLSRHVKRIIIDDGWQYCYGEWDANPLFPSGMEKVARRLVDMGFEPGIWMAPTVIEPHARIAQWDTDMLAMGESGLPCLAYECMKRVGFVLDPTREKTRKWLYDLYRRYHAMGYSYFKIDFIWQTLKARRFFLNDVPRAKLMEMIIQPIREAAGNSHILGCFYHDGPNAYTDSMRITSDVHAKWSSATQNAVSIATRFAMHNRLWINDPDFIVCRCPETSDDPDLNRLRPSLVYVAPEHADGINPYGHDRNDGLSSMTFEEAKVLISLVIVSGGPVNISDKVTLLNEKGLDLLRRAVSARKGDACVPLDMFEHEYPRTWLQRLGSGFRILLVNWEDKPCELVFDLQNTGQEVSELMDFWNDTPVEIRSGRLVANLQPHSCMLVETPCAS